VTQSYLVSIELAQLAVDNAQSALSKDHAVLAGDQKTAAEAASAESAAADALKSDQSDLGRAASGEAVAQARLSDDRTRLRSFALALYVGDATGVQPTTLRGLEQNQEAVFDQDEGQLVGEFVITNLHADTSAADSAARLHRQLLQVVAEDERKLTLSQQKASSADAVVATDQRRLAGDEGELATDQNQLHKANASLTAALANIPGPLPAAAGGITVMGPSTLSPNQLAGWFSAQGYADHTSTPISQLAVWYVQAGNDLGVRGDVAFAQAVLETGGFSSPDAVGLNNYAGIGHCDSCAAGWQFPSPQDGVIGQLQLLRIFAGGGAPPKGAPAPVLPSLVSSQTGESGCCATWESLTGVWATDPAYSVKILTMYLQMLNFAESSGQQIAAQSGN
jgi:hypothetical protein